MAAERVTPSGRVVGLDIDAGMLAVARSRPPSHGVNIQWEKGSVQDMAFDNDVFDIVLCCQGLQFFPDRPAALSEMRRVLKRGGRLAVSVWCSVEHWPGHFMLAQAMAEPAGTEPAKMPPFSLNDSGELESLVSEANFADIKTERVVKISRYKSTKSFIEALVAGAPSTRHALANFDYDARRSIIRAVTASLEHYEDSEGLAIPMESHILTARA